MNEQSYTDYRSELPEQQAGQNLLREMQAQQSAQLTAATEGKSAKAPQKPAEPSAAAPSSPAAQPAGAETPPTKAAQGASVMPSGVMQDMGELAPKAGAVAKDVAKGVLQENARGVYTGVRNALQATYDKMDDFTSWANAKIPLVQHVLAAIPGEGLVQAAQAYPQIRKWIDQKEVKDPTSVTGQLIQGTAQFLTGMAMTRGLGFAGGVAGSAAHAGAASAIAFDPWQARLSNLVEQFPALSNPVTRLLEAKPDDSEVVGMAKTALENMGLGPLTDGFVKAVRLLGAAKGAEIPIKAPGLSDEAFSILGDPKAALGEPLLQTHEAAPEPKEETGKLVGISKDLEGGPPKQIPSSAAGRAMEPPQTYINFARIDAPTDVQRVMQEIANAREAPKDQARAGVMSFEDMKASASQQDAWNILKGRREGDPLPADQMTAARQLWLSSTQKLIETARVAQGAPSEENLFAVRKMMEVHGWISDQVTGATTAAARSVASMRIPVGPSDARMQEVADRLDSVAGGAGNVRDIAKRIVALADSTSPDASHQLQIFAEKSVGARARDAVIQFFRDSLLSSPVSQARILASNVSTAVWRLGERKVAEGVSALMQTEGGVAPGEAAAMYSGWIGSFKDAMTYGWKAAQTGATGAGIGDVPHEQFPSNISAEALNLSGAPGRIADFVGQAASWGFGFGGRRAIIAQHDMALTMAYNAELHAQAVRQVTSGINAGEIPEGEFAERVAGLLHSSDGTPAESIAAPARAQAKYQAFLDQPGQDTIGKLTNWMIDGRRQIPALNAVIPFIKIPSRILSYTFERTPLAPLMSDFRSKVAAGGASRDLALAQLAVGSMITATAADMVASGTLKGGGPPEKGLSQAQEREGEKRDSIKIGDSWYNINGVHPAGKLMLLAADVAEAIQGGQHELKDDEDTTKIAVGTSLAIARTLTNASYMQGLSNLFATVHDAKVGGAGESALLSSAGSLVPQASASVARAMDPYQREIYTMLDEFKSKIPGLSKTLPERRDLWGDAVSSGHDPLTRLASPVQFAKETHSPIDDEILKQGMNITLPGRQQSFGPPGEGVRIDMSKYPKEYSRFVQLAGNEYKDPAWGLGAKDLLNAIVSGNHPLSDVYNMKTDGPEGGKAQMVRGIIHQYREGALNQLLEESPKLSNQVDTMRETMQALKVVQ